MAHLRAHRVIGGEMVSNRGLYAPTPILTILLAVFLLFCDSCAWSAEAARIDTISPTAGRPGDLVAITGIGFGGHNVIITVAGVPAQVLSATGNQVTFIV